MKKVTSKITALMLSLIMMLGCIPNIANAETFKSLDNFVKVQDYHEGMFNDVKPNDWYHENVSSVYEINLMIGREHDMFDAEENMTVAEAFTIAARLNSIYYTGKADFIQGELWYEVYTNYCKENNIADPSKYDLEKPITRGEFAEIFSKALPEEVLEEINKIKDGSIPDVKMNDAFSAAIYMLYRVGILTGIDEAGYFNSNSNIQRMEAAAITTRMVKPSLRKSVTLDDTKNKTQYTVTFNLVYNGETFDSVKVLDGEKVERPSNPTRSKYKFIGWYDKEEGGTKFDFDTEITTNIVLFAHWKKNSSGSSSGTSTIPLKGDIITLNNDSEHAYRVLSIEGSKAFVVSMYNVSETDKNFYQENQETRTQGYIQYAESDIDNYLENTWYEGLDITMKDAIEATTIDQPGYVCDYTAPETGTYFAGSNSSNNYYIIPDDSKTAEVGNRHVYLLDVKDVVEYLGAGNLTSAKLNKMFFGTESNIRRFCWLRSFAATVNPNYAFYVNGNYADMRTDLYYYPKEIRAAFTIDLSKVDYDIVPGLYTVTFDLNGVYSTIVPQTVVKDGKVKKPTDPTYTDHTFAGWYKDSGYTTEWDFDNDAITEDTTLYAKWETTIDKLVGTIPTSEDKDTAPSNAWTAEGEFGTNTCYLAENKLYFLCPKDDAIKSTGIALSTKVVKVGNTYLYSNGLITFAMTGGNLSSIQFTSPNTDYTKYNGTYTAPTPKFSTIADILATVTSIPSSNSEFTAPANSWENEAGKKMYIYDSGFGSKYLEATYYSLNITESVISDGTNWTCEYWGGVTFTFIITGEELTSVVISGAENDVNGTYTPQ